MKTLQTRFSLGADADLIRERAALWCAYSHHFFGSLHGVDVPYIVRPMSCDEACAALAAMKDPRPPVVGRCLHHMYASGYRPKRYACDHFNKLLKVADRYGPAARRHPSARYEQHVMGDRESASSGAPERDVAADLESISPPTEVTFTRDFFTVKKELQLNRPFGDVEWLVRPENWRVLGPFFDKTAVVRQPTLDKPFGEFYEHFVLDWTLFRFQVFDVRLKVELTTDTDRIRADFALMYEEDDEIHVDDGYVEARAIEDKPGWTAYTGEKSLRFANGLYNFLTPAVVAMFLENKTDWVESIVARGEPPPLNEVKLRSTNGEKREPEERSRGEGRPTRRARR